MNTRAVALALLVGLAAPTTLLAQEGEGYQRGQLYEISTWEIDPADAAAFEALVMQVADAAAKSKIAYHWVFWQDGSQYTLVFPVSSFAYFDDPEQFVRAFQGTAGEAQMREAMAKFPQIRSQVVAEEMVEVKQDWSYQVEGFGLDKIKYGHIDVLWSRPGMDEEFDKLNKEWVQLFKDLNYPYAFDAHSVHFGDTGRTVYVTFIDDLSKFYGENDLAKLIEAKNLGARADALDQRFNAATVRWKHYNSMLRMDLSYWPEPAAQATK